MKSGAAILCRPAWFLEFDTWSRFRIPNAGGVLVAVFLSLLMMLLSGCTAHAQDRMLVNHSVVIRNKGSQLIRDVVIVYGSERIVFEGGYVRGAGRGFMGEMLVSPQITVEWKTKDGEVHEQILPVKLKDATPKQLDALKIEFTDGGIELYQGVAADKYSSDYTRIYP